ncbi:formate dehydrogenase [Haematobacter massiliensis]|uniref:Formate dehydrogenase n=1 Tax=Haematobacter massiliensis TaxID=195105 RepID=A0A086Y318_9RHOB|nr:formate dehydrogenase subunit delta [Haematobacter massiliensis]KFI28668.1 formate dehydrogenase [Haematobacter massiliensis]OWJ73517.1 formate dehydrogenase [Haematobacter massiliensis]OWJ88599.1 formate dehydrogenase [Haematobacter massiliensis]QBJ26213.1 formate dehydrogenase [Haematobacter massiliensis]
MSNTDERLVRMANQIALFMETRPREAAAAGVASHINDYWEPRMRSRLLALAAEPEGDALRPLVREALPTIRKPAAERA